MLASDGDYPNTADNRDNAYAISRTLFNIIPTSTVKSSTAGFLNWMCDGGGPSGTGAGAVSPMQAKGPDRFTGVNYDTDLTNIIQGQYGFSRLSDTSAELPLTAQSVNGVANPNGTCAAIATISSFTSPNQINLTSLPSEAQVGWTVEIPNGYSEKLGVVGTVANGFVGDTIDTISAISGNTITLTNNYAAGTGSKVPPTLYFPGHPPVTAVTDTVG